ncbi:hypothetical protein HUW51_06465 [Adhaeribacter swui]|uniref:Uncharacterized protein n=1 Tax=Adhaeribacter swui TaxID=2086471 RepID=A0A7G7G5F6_9BACT|nr:hypothetical protein [Adhaeribacter swui]QNF32390.1 hypothetical protein HUW51_06465 [Adhaeribacter swui]
MKVTVNEKPFLPDGRHVVTITEIEEGTSENKNVPFINCRLENEEGFINQRFYLSEPGQPILASFFKALGLDKTEVDTKELQGKTLSVEVEERTYTDADGKEKTIKQATNFELAGKANISHKI